MLRIKLFGSPQLLLDDQPVVVERRKSRALLYYLAANPRPSQREHLLAFFWPDTERSSAQQVLRTTLHGLRKTLGDGLLIERESIGIAPEVEVDARMFEKNLVILPMDALKLSSIVDLYSGRFLEDFSLPDTPSFEDWVAIEQERYLRLAMRAFGALSQAYENSQDYRSALASLDRALALDPLQEDLQREAIRLAYLAGDRPQSIRRYDQLRKLLDEELGVPPMAETRALYDDIINDHIAALPARVPLTVSHFSRSERPPLKTRSQQLPFQGRSAELTILKENAYSHRLILIEGEAGIGKTRLVEQFLLDLPDAVCLAGAAHELEQTLPYQPVIEGLRRLQTEPEWPVLLSKVRSQLTPVWLGEVARMLPDLDSGQKVDSITSADEWRLWEGYYQFLVTLSRLRPVMVSVDDLQWSDPSTLGLLGYLVRHSGDERLGFVTTTRTYPNRSPLANLITALTREGRLLRVPLARFSDEEIKNIAQPYLSENDPLAISWLQRRSEGNPYILSELLRHARQNHWLRPDGTLDSALLATEMVVPSNVYNLLQTRQASLSESARRILETAVMVGRDFDFELVSKASAFPEEAALDGLDELLEAGLAEPTQTPGYYRFDHSLTMEVAFREVGEARRRLIHRRIAEAMQNLYRRSKLDNIAGLLAFHFSEGNDFQKAAPYALKAGQQALRLGAWREAISFFRKALSGLEGWPQYEVLMELGKAYQNAGESALSTEMFHSAALLAEEQGDVSSLDEARLMIAQSLLQQARFAESIVESQKVIEHGLSENTYRAELGWGAALSLEGADLVGAEEHLSRAAAFSHQAAQVDLKAQIEFELGSVWAQRGDLETAIQHYHNALVLANQSDSPEAVQRQVLAHNNLAYHLLLLGDPEAEQQAQEGMTLAQEKGLLGLQPYLYSTLGEVALAKQDYSTAEENFNAGLNLARKFSFPERIAGLTANLGLVARNRGQIPLAIHRLSTALAQADNLGLPQLSAQIRIWLAPLLPVEEARAQLAEARAIAEGSGRKRLLGEVDRLAQALVER